MYVCDGDNDPDSVRAIGDDVCAMGDDVCDGEGMLGRGGGS